MLQMSVQNILLFAGLLLALPLSIQFGKYMLDRDIERAKAGMGSMGEEKERILSDLDSKRRERAYLEKKLADLSALYTITKEMSFAIRFGELLRSLKGFLEDNFEFTKFAIVFFRHRNGGRVVDRIYGINGKIAENAKLDSGSQGLAVSAAKSKKPEFFENNGENILAVPLMTRRKVAAVMLVKNITEDDRDRFLILAPQIALQVERISLFADVEKLSVTDGLTGVFLRRYFLGRFREEIERAKACHMPLSFIMLDLDRFKNCNDRFGHLVGDVVLKKVAEILKKNVREIDIVARYGGEEFCILLPESDKEGAYAVGERVRKAVENCVIKAYDESVRITVSMGVSCFPGDAGSPAELIEAADKALYEAKTKGRNRTCLAKNGDVSL